jgi:branched-chain amino acid transport system substrate-binding protein
MTQNGPNTSRNNRGISTILAVAIIIVALVVGLVGGYFIAPRSSTSTQKLSGTINIGVAIPLTGALGTYGLNAEWALKLAQSQINNLLTATSAGYQLNLIFEDTQTKSDIALTATQDLASKGCQVILGYYSSSELSNCLNYAQSNQIVLISPSSTAISLAIDKPFIYRFVPADDKQGPAMAYGMRDMGINYIVPIWLGNTYGDGLAQATTTKFAALGGAYDSKVIRYDPNAADFSSEVGVLAQEVQTAVNQYGASKVAVYAVTYEEITSIMTTAKQYPILSQVRWFGCDGSALSAKVTADPVVGAFAVNVTFPATYFAPPNSPLLQQVSDYVHSQTGNIPDPYAYGSYDSLWVVAKCIGLTQQYTGSAVNKVLPQVANLTYGSSGWTALNGFGDRTIGDYQFWQVYQVTAAAAGHNATGEYSWYLAGLYQAATNTVTWYPAPTS